MDIRHILNNCILCPRKCGVDRTSGHTGACHMTDTVRVSRAALHMWEEPCISGENGSGAVFFSGCALGCCFCQNKAISGGKAGKDISISRLCNIFFELQDKGANNINLVTPGQWRPWITAALDLARAQGLHLPIVCNTGGYETVENVEAWRGYIDIWLADLKYVSPALAAELSAAPDYFAQAKPAIEAMMAQAGHPVFDADGILQRGVILRHLALPGHIDDSFAELGGELTAEQTQVADNYAQQLMDQYGSTYTANGIGLETLKAFERIQLKHTLLLTLVYGPDGESPVDDSDLTEHLDSQMYELAYVNIPLYNTSTFVSASDDQKAQMLQLAQAAAASCSETQDGSVSEQVSALHSAASAALPDIYAALDSTPAEDAANVQTELLTESDLTGAFTQDGAADAVRGLVYGEAAAVQYNAASIILMMRIDPLQVSTLDALRTQILSDMKGDELEDALTAYGSTLENNLSTSAMNKMPASKIVNPSSSSNS